MPMPLPAPLFTQTGTVVRGAAEARTLGFPTLNIVCEAPSLLSGTYAGIVTVGENSYQAAVYVDIKRKIFEAHLFEFSDDLYGQTVTFQLFKFIVLSKRFIHETEQQQFIEAAVQAVKKYFIHVL